MVQKKVVKKKTVSKSTKKNPVKKTPVTRTKTAPKDDILKYIQLAINTEKRGIKFYTEAKSKVDDYNMNKLMDVLLEQENKHLEIFKAIYNAEKKSTAEAAKEAAKYKSQKPIENPLFRMRHLHDVVKKKATIYHLFKKAVEFEEDGHDLYVDLAKKIKNKKISNFLKMIANEELKHKDFILTHQDAIYNTGHWFGWDHVRLEM